MASLATSVAYSVVFISLYYSLCCNMVSDNASEVVYFGHEPTLLWLSIFFCLFGSPLLWIGTTYT